MIKIKLTFYDLIGFIFKHKWFIVIFTIAASAIGFWFVAKSQTYTAQGVIRYIDLDTETDNTPQGNKLDVYEIISPRIISEAIQTLGSSENAESIRSKCTIVGIIPDDIAELKEAKQKDGNEYTYFPKDYIISYTVGSDKTPEDARDMVDAILSAYTDYYSRTYLSEYTLPEIKFDTVESEHDYIETAEIIDDAVGGCLQYFDNTSDGNEDFRSPRTGYTFKDMARFYGDIKNVTMPDIFSRIIDGHITKNREVLLKTYQYKIENAGLESDSKERVSQTAFNLMNTFVNANKDVPSSYGEGDDDDAKYYSYEVHDKIEGAYDETTYDQLVDNYVSYGVSSGEDDIDAEYYQSIYDVFSSPAPEDVDSAALVADIESDISEMLKKVDELYDISNTFMVDFRRYQLTKNINMLTNITTKGNSPESLLQGLVVIICMMLSVILAIGYEIVMLTKKSTVSEETL